MVQEDIPKQKDAYRYFFPAGWLLGLWGVILWILFPWNLVSYPGSSHPEIMAGGFFLLFVCGFLMTAAPRFTATYPPTRNEQGISFFLILALFASLLFADKAFFYTVVVALFGHLIRYVAVRFRDRKSQPPDAFLFVGLGMILGFLGAGLLWVHQFVSLPSGVLLLGRLLFLHAYIVSLVLGVGSRLLPMLLGDSARVVPRWVYGVLALLFALTFGIEAFGESRVAYLVRALVVSGVALYFWRIYRWPSRKAVQSLGLWFSAWLLVLGHWGLVLAPHFRVHTIHVILAASLGLMTFLIATRVGLAHGNHDLGIEKNSKLLAVAAVLIGFAGLTRWSAGLAPHIYESHLKYAAWVWVLGLLLWGYLMIPRIVRVREPGPRDSRH